MLIVCTKIISARPKLLQKPRDFQVFLIPEKESSSNSDNSYDDEVGHDTAVDDDTTNSNFEIELPVISSSPHQDTSPMQFPSLTRTVEASSVIGNISSNPPAAKPTQMLCEQLLQFSHHGQSLQKLGKQRGMRTRGGRKNNFSTRPVPVTR